VDGNIIRGRGAVAACALAAIIVAGCASTALVARGGQPRVDAEVQARASAFESFTRKAQAIDAGFTGPAAVSQALQVGAGYEPKQLEAGLIAYSAMAALQEPRFVAGVQAAGRSAKARRDLVRRLASRPDLAVDLPGGKLAAGRANAALARQAAPLADSGRQVKKASYSIQRQAWANAKTADAAGRLSRVKLISSQGYRPDGGDAARLAKAVAEGGRRGGEASPAVARGLAVAALTVLGEGGQAKTLLKEPKTGMCLRVAKLNLYQCLASAGPYYEDIYCLGEHAMIEPGQCVMTAADPPRRQQRAGLTP